MDLENAISDVRAAATRVEESVRAVDDARQRLQRAALGALLAVAGDEERERELVRTLYWEVPELPVKALDVAVGPAARARELAGPGPVLGTCDVCGTEVRAASRTHLTTGQARCKPCEPKLEPVMSQMAGWDEGWYSELRDPGDPPEQWEAGNGELAEGPPRW